MAKKSEKQENMINREISWLSFNHRVLQEAADPRVPLFERLKFLAIFSSNLDEFFRVRVASLRTILDLSKKGRKKLRFDPNELYQKILEIVKDHQEEFGRIYRYRIQPLLNDNGIHIRNENELDENQHAAARKYFNENIRQHCTPVIIAKQRFTPFLKNRGLYLAVNLEEKNSGKTEEAFVKIPSDRLPRFVALPGDGHNAIFLDDIIRLGLPEIFYGYEVESAYSVKLTRDAELYIDDEFTGALLSKIKKSLKKRETGVPCRFLFDKDMPSDMRDFLREALALTREDMVEGGRYHNFHDFFGFPPPEIKERMGEKYEELTSEPLLPMRSRMIDEAGDIFIAAEARDRLLYFPCHSYEHVIEFFDRAADDPYVTDIYATQYRVATDSKIVAALIRASQKGKNVVVFVELKARFDEEHNIYWAEEMERAGVKVFYSFPGLKVHAKIALVNRTEHNHEKKYCYLSTGNFNEKNARLYTDIGFFTTHERIAREAARLFDYLQRREAEFNFKYLLVGQFNLRQRLKKLIKKEIKFARAGEKAEIRLKVNSLEDRKMVRWLYEASRNGVKVKIICRGICRLIPGVPGLSDNIEVRSIVDRFLEHARIYIFHNDGDELMYCSSADWMKRNLSRRVEVAFPIFDEESRQRIRDIIEIQLSDNYKARIIDAEQKNEYTERGDFRAQTKLFEYFENLNQNMNP